MKQLLVRFILTYLRYFARIALKKNHPTVIGITGSFGKSSARDMLYAILKDHFPTKVVAENSEIGLPLGILGIKPSSLGFETPVKSTIDWIRMLILAPLKTNSLKGTKYLIVEMGIDEPYPPKNMEYLLTIVKPDIAIFLNAAAVHTMQFEKVLAKRHSGDESQLNRDEDSRIKNRSWTSQDDKWTEEEKTAFLVQKIADEKVKIITESGCKVGIYNADNEFVVNAITNYSSDVKHVIASPDEIRAKQSHTAQHELTTKHSGSRLAHAHSNNKLLTFGKANTNTISFKEYEVSLEGTSFTFSFDKHNFTVDLKQYLLPEEYRETIAASILGALQTGLSINEIVQSLQDNFTLPKGRASLLEGIYNSVLIDSSYNASRVPTVAMLDMLNTLKKQTKRPTAFLFGDMRELGDEARSEHEKVIEKMVGIVENLYCVGQLTRQYVLPYLQPGIENGDIKMNNVRWFDNAHRAGEYLKEFLPEHTILLVKGSQNTIYLEEAVKYILKDNKDENKLCRQEPHWLKRKKQYFNK